MPNPTIISAEYVSAYVVRIGFDDGKIGNVDLESELWGEVFEPLKNIETFKQFTLSKELRTVVWPNGADFAPEFIYQKLCESLDPTSQEE